MLKRAFRAWRLALLIIAILACALGIWHAWHALHPDQYPTPQENDPFVRFDMEAYDTISENYWVRPGNYAQFGAPELPELYRLAAAKASGSDVTLATSTRAAVAAMLAKTFSAATSTDAKRQLALSTLQVVMYNLPPAGRGGILSKQEETALRQNVANVNPDQDLYTDLGLKKGANAAAVEAAFKQKSAELAASSSPAAHAALEAATHAHEILGNEVGKALYDQTGAESSVLSRIYGHTLYLAFNKISPTTLQEFAYAVDHASTTPLENLILDMRGNVGGQLSFAQAFMGLFLGPNQYAFDLYHQGDTEAQRTTQNKFDALARFTQIAVLTDEQTQSTAELTTAALKRFHLATVVGTKTRGWGSVEDTYPLTTEIDPATSYALFVVNHLTLRDDNEPIEQNGVIPDVDTSQAGWEKKLSVYFDASFANVVKTRLAEAPLR